MEPVSRMEKKEKYANSQQKATYGALQQWLSACVVTCTVWFPWELASDGVCDAIKVHAHYCWV